jgi:hypothetical protein
MYKFSTKIHNHDILFVQIKLQLRKAIILIVSYKKGNGALAYNHELTVSV